MTGAAAEAQTFLDRNCLVFGDAETVAEELVEIMRAAVLAELNTALMAAFPGCLPVHSGDAATVLAAIAVTTLKAVEVEIEFGVAKPAQAIAETITKFLPASAVVK